MSGRRTIRILGGGVIGWSGALALARRGRAVTVVDPGPIPHPLAASTDISKMIRMDYGNDPLYVEMMERAFPLWDAWNVAWGESLWHRDGFLLLSAAPLARGGFEHDSFETLTRRGHPLDRLDAASIASRHPAWESGRYVDGYYNPLGGWAESGRVVARLAAAAIAAGVTHLAQRADVGCGADVVLVAAGAWTPLLVPELREIVWAVGQPVFHLRPDDPDAFRAPRFVPWAADIARTGWYGFPANADGIVKIANHGPGRRVHPDDPREVDAGAEERLRLFLRESIPSLAEAPLVGTRLCLYADSFDGDFVIDRVPGRDDVVVATGDSGHAFKFAPILGELVADVVEREANPFARRFAWRAPDARSAERARYGLS